LLAGFEAIKPLVLLGKYLYCRGAANTIAGQMPDTILRSGLELRIEIIELLIFYPTI
jgi:hypothetical protein